MTPYQYCQDVVNRTGSSFSAGILCLPRPQKEALVVLYAFCRAVDDIVDTSGDKELARIKLHWWYQEIERVFKREATHPIGQALQQQVLPYFSLPREYLLEVINGMEMDLFPKPYQTFEELEVYCYRVAGVVGLMIAQILGFKEVATQQYAIKLGTALQLINIIRDVGEDALVHRLYLPLQDLEQYDVTSSEIYGLQFNAKVHDLLIFQAKRARQQYQEALEYLAPCDKKTQKPGLIMAAIYLELLRAIEKEGFNTLQYKIALPRWRQLWIALKAC